MKYFVTLLYEFSKGGGTMNFRFYEYIFPNKLDIFKEYLSDNNMNYNSFHWVQHIVPQINLLDDHLHQYI